MEKCVSSPPMEHAMEQVIPSPNPSKRKSRKTDVTVLAREMSFKVLISQGYSQQKASEMLGLAPSTGGKIAARLREKGDDPQALVSACRNEKLGKFYDHVIGKGLKMKAFKGSDVVAVAKDYRSVAYPSRQEVGGDSYQFVQINMAPAAPVPQGLGPDSTTRCGVLEVGETVDGEILNEISIGSGG